MLKSGFVLIVWWHFCTVNIDTDLSVRNPKPLLHGEQLCGNPRGSGRGLASRGVSSPSPASGKLFQVMWSALRVGPSENVQAWFERLNRF
jgi:hypothetical protein